MKWMNAMTDKLQSSGHMCMVVPYPSAFEWIASANAHGLYCHHRMDVYSFHDDLNPTRSLLHFQRKLKMPEKSRLDIYASLNQYTEAYLDFTKINQHPDRLKRNGLSQ